LDRNTRGTSAEEVHHVVFIRSCGVDLDTGGQRWGSKETKLLSPARPGRNKACSRSRSASLREMRQGKIVDKRTGNPEEVQEIRLARGGLQEERVRDTS